MRNRWRATLVPPGVLVILSVWLSVWLVASTALRTPVFALRASAGHPPQAPGSEPQSVFHVRLETTKGDVVLEVTRAWAPHGADRFIDLVRAHYYDDCRLFRVIKGQWAQFGIAGDPAVAQAWRT
ncbi:MAG TPA: peptidylprolyl isomerase, partial [Vicinamibacterales bacterium]